MKTISWSLSAVALCLSAAPLAAADVFDRHTSEILRAVAEAQEPVERLDLESAARLKSLSARISSPALVVRTNDGNWAKALVTWGYRKGPEEPVPVLLIERYVTYRGDRENVAVADGGDVMLFAGFEFNFDIGQVVPSGQGGDVTFSAESILRPLDEARIYTLDGSQLPPADEGAPNDPADHEGVLPRDFSGTWHIDIDGRWSGEWELAVDDDGRATGTFTSDETKSRYPITGRLTGQPHQIRLQVQLENAGLAVDAYLWTTDKSAMAGVATLAERRFGFLGRRQNDAAEEKE